MEQHLQRARQLRQESDETDQLNEERKTLDIEIDELTKKQTFLRSDLENCRNKNETLMKNIDELKLAIIENVKKNKEISDTMVMKSRDNARLIKAKEMLDLGKALTGVRWNYSAPESLVAGYISNKQKEILKSFEHSANEENLQIELWNQIEAPTSADWSDLLKLYIEDNIKCDKENKPNNVN